MKKFNIFFILLLISILAGCSKDFLKPDPLSFYEPEITFSTKEGLQAALVTCDRHLRHYFTHSSDAAEAPAIYTSYILSEVGVNGTTDVGDNTRVSVNMNAMFQPGGNNSDATGTMSQWSFVESYSGIKYANSIISNLPNITGLDTETYNTMLGRAYFHRTWRYMNLHFSIW